MIPEAREAHLSKKDRKVLEACCRSPVTMQPDLKRARIVLLAAAGRSTRSIAKEVGVQPRIVSLWRHRYADHGLEGLQDKPRPGKQPIYTKATDKRILRLLDKPAPEGFARWTGPLLAEALGDVDVQYVWRFLRNHKIDLVVRKSWCESNDPHFTAKAADVVGLYVAPPPEAIVLCVDEKPSIQALERAQGYLKLPNGRALTGQSHDYKRGMARQRCLRHLKSPPERSSRRIQNGGVVSSSSTSWTASPRLFRTASFTSSSTISTPTRRTSTGSRPTPMCNFISRRQARPGSIRSRFGSRSCRDSRSAALPSQASNSSSSTSMPTSKPTTTKLSPSSGQRKRSVNADSKAAVSLSFDSGY